MTALSVQKELNNALANRSFKKAYILYVLMNELRKNEGLERLTLKNLESKMAR